MEYHKGILNFGILEYLLNFKLLTSNFELIAYVFGNC